MYTLLSLLLHILENFIQFGSPWLSPGEGNLREIHVGLQMGSHQLEVWMIKTFSGRESVFGIVPQ